MPPIASSRSTNETDNASNTPIENARNYIQGPEKDTRTQAICDAAKNQGILIYTIGFEAPTAAERADCWPGCGAGS